MEKSLSPKCGMIVVYVLGLLHVTVFSSIFNNLDARFASIIMIAICTLRTILYSRTRLYGPTCPGEISIYLNKNY